MRYEVCRRPNKNVEFDDILAQFHLVMEIGFLSSTFQHRMDDINCYRNLRLRQKLLLGT